MTAPFAKDLLGWKWSGKRLVPNTADVHSKTSVSIASALLESLGVDGATASDVSSDRGSALEHMCRDDLQRSLSQLVPTRHSDVRCGTLISEFEQYRHLKRLDLLVREQPDLRVTLGMDYLIKPDVTVALPPECEPDSLEDYVPFLHAVISCKWTIRSDRVQNIRHEFGQMIRHRRGRLPHLVTLTAEPLPTRLASIARGTGEVDATYHVALSELTEAVSSAGNTEQQDALDECVSQGRLRPYSELAPLIAAR